jgi:hypothetical protein
MRLLVIIALLGVILVSGVVVSTTSYGDATAQDTAQEDAAEQLDQCGTPVASPSASPEASPSLVLPFTPIASPEASPAPCGQPVVS